MIHHGDCIKIMRQMEAASIDAIVTDPPYGLGFMGKKWDALPPGEGWAAECLRVLKPGGHMLAFGGARTWHRLAVAVEDAGFEIRDSIAWLYGSGMPKSMDVSKAIDKAAGVEREVVGTRDSRGVYDGRTRANSNVFSGSTYNNGNAGGDTIRPLTAPATPAAEQWEGWGTALKPAFEPIIMARKPLIGTVAANVMEHGTGALNVEKGRTAEGRWPANAALSEACSIQLGEYAKFFYMAKAAKSERPVVAGIAHPTVKPLALMRWLCKLVTPEGGMVLDPFAGSGTTVEAALLEGFSPIGIEREADYLPLIQARLDRSAA